jgi:hypothetical protein
MSGVDWIDSEEVSSSTPEGAILVSLDLNPINWPNTHIGAMARTFEKYRFTRLVMKISTRVPTIAAGGYVAAINPDPTVTISGTVARRMVRALPGSISAPWWQSSQVTLACDGRWLYTANSGSIENVRWVSPGKFVLICDAPPLNVAGTGKMRVVVEMVWTVEFAVPSVAPLKKLEPLSVERGTYTVGSDGMGIKATGSFGEAWDSSNYDYVYALDPAMPAASHETTFAGSAVNVKYMRSMKGSDDVKYWLGYSELDEAIRAGPNPARDGTINVTFGKTGAQSFSAVKLVPTKV